MPLFEFTNKTQYGQLRKRIVHNDSSQFTIKRGFGDFVAVRPFKYITCSLDRIFPLQNLIRI